MQELGAKPGVLQPSAGLRPKATRELVDSETSKASTCPARGCFPGSASSCLYGSRSEQCHVCAPCSALSLHRAAISYGPKELLNPGFCNFGNAATHILPRQKNPALPAHVSFPAVSVISPRSVSIL